MGLVRAGLGWAVNYSYISCLRLTAKASGLLIGQSSRWGSTTITLTWPNCMEVSACMFVCASLFSPGYLLPDFFSYSSVCGILRKWVRASGRCCQPARECCELLKGKHCSSMDSPCSLSTEPPDIPRVSMWQALPKEAPWPILVQVAFTSWQCSSRQRLWVELVGEQLGGFSVCEPAWRCPKSACIGCRTLFLWF